MKAGRTDAVIVGGGLVGLAAAHGLSRAGLSCVHLAPTTGADRRTSALMGPSTETLRRLGVFTDPAELGTPLKRIRIIDATHRLIRAPETLFDCAEAGLPAFGWNLPNAAMSEAFTRLAADQSRLERRSLAATGFERISDGWRVHTDDGPVDAPLLVGADGKTSAVRKHAGISVRERSFSQAALVADLVLERPLNGESVEFHYPEGPFTLVPAGERRANLVWIDAPSVLDEVGRLDEAALSALFTERSKNLFGRIDAASPTFQFPLSTLTAAVAGSGGLVLVGESAHAFPPIGAQGLNLGLRDVEALLRCVEEADVQDAGWAERVGRAYARDRARDIRLTSRFVDTLFRSLLSDFLPAQSVRAGGLWALKLSRALRRRAFEAGMGGR